MSLLTTTQLLMAQTSLPVEVTNASDGGFDWTILLPPTLTFIGVVTGVWLGARLSRKTLRGIEQDRADREDHLDKQRARHERELDEERAGRDRRANQRIALAALRVLAGALDTSIRYVETAAEEGEWWIDLFDARLDASDDDLRAAATWLAPSAWEALVSADETLGQLQKLRDINPREFEDDAAALRLGLAVLHGAQQELRHQAEQLVDEIELLEPAPKDPGGSKALTAALARAQAELARRGVGSFNESGNGEGGVESASPEGPSAS